MLPEILAVRHAGDPLDRDTEQREAAVGIGKAAARRERWFLAGDQRQDVARGPRLQHRVHVLRPEEVAQPRTVRQQLPDGDARRLRCEPAHNLADGFIEAELASVDQLPDRNRSEHLARRREVEPRRWRDRRTARPCHSAAVDPRQDPVSLRDHDRSGQIRAGGGRRQAALHAVVTHRGCGREGGGQGSQNEREMEQAQGGLLMTGETLPGSQLQKLDSSLNLRRNARDGSTRR